MTSNTRLLTVGVILALASSAAAIRCWKCGQYSDGVGSITPCNNRSAGRLEECASNAKYCIKYVSELTVVRDCVPACKENELWGARTFCCNVDGCNSAFTSSPATLTLAIAVILAYLTR